ncbi:MAG TPA: RNA polymerase sigma factor [Thermoanaerobaculia bacterium]|jgi:RNA polymerase sigma-70 factor (ECF subfamily)|nr:RNA polymerase sigma factor [Thermoanaerobaculia bacterium]
MSAPHAGERATLEASNERTPSAGDEAALLDALRDGDPAAARGLVDATYGRIHDALFRLCGNRDLAADLTQETYRKAWQSLNDFGGRARFSTWLFRIAYNTFLNHVRRPLRLVPLADTQAAEVPDPTPGRDAEMAARDEHRQVRQAVLALGEQQRFVVTAHYWAELPIAEIARLEGVTGAAIRKRLARALGILEVTLLQEVTR